MATRDESEPTKPRRAPFAARVALAACALVLAWMLAEVVLRVAHLPVRFAHPRHLESHDKRVGLDAYPTNPRGYFDVDLRDANARAPFEQAGVRDLDAWHSIPFAVAFHYNDDLCRDRPRTPRTPGTARVLVLGDSFTEGQGVRADDTFSRRLSIDLAASGSNAEVWNCGRRGFDFPELYKRFDRLEVYDADVVVYAMVLNDAVQSSEFHARQAFLNDWILDRRRMVQDGNPTELPWWRSRVWALASDVREAARVGDATTAWYRDMYAAPNAAGWSATQAFLRRMNEATRSRGAVFIVDLLPLLVDRRRGYPFDDVHREIARACRSLGIEFHDARPALARERARTLWVHPVDMHPNERAHARIAADLAPVVAGAIERTRTRWAPR